MQIDTAQAARFIAALAGDSTLTFQTFPDPEDLRKRKEGKPLIRILHGTFPQRMQSLARLNERGAGVFVMVNAGDGCGRKAANVIGARALFVDLDGAPIEPVLSGPLSPRMVVESSPGRWHAYWPIADLPLERFTDAQKALAGRFGADPKVHDRPRVMRLPGFLHRKATPFLSRLVSCDPSPLTWHEVTQAFGLRERYTLPESIPEGQRNEQLYRLARSAQRKGVPEAEQVNRALLVNSSRCSPPLAPEEVVQVVASAYRTPAQGFAGIPLAVMDDEAYRAASDGARSLLLLAYRKRDAFSELFPLPWSECRPWFSRENTFLAYRKELVARGLLVPVVAPVPRQPRNGRGPKAGLYRVGNTGDFRPYSISPIPAQTACPEALQALASEALNVPDFESGRFAANRGAA